MLTGTRQSLSRLLRNTKTQVPKWQGWGHTSCPLPYAHTSIHVYTCICFSFLRHILTL